MRKKLVTILVVLMFLNVAGLSFAVIGTSSEASVETSVEKSSISKMNDQPLDMTDKLKNKVVEGAVGDTGNTWNVIVNDDATGDFYYLGFERIFAGVNCNIWVGMDSQYDRYVDNGNPGYDEEDIWYFSYPWSADGYVSAAYPDGYYLYPGYEDYITGAQLKYLVDIFDNNIHKQVTEHFGEYLHRPGPLGDGKIQILIFNIRDEFFYSPYTAPGYIAGYFWSYASEINNANLYHIDTYQWWRRVGADPEMPAPYDDPTYWSPLPLQYEGTMAHEFEHLVHYDVDPNELSWVDEGLADLAMYFCGFGFSAGHISEFLLWFWDTPLVLWEGYLSDYGASFMWAFYMWEHYGGDLLIWDLTHEQADGIAGWQNVLKAHGIRKSFDQIFQDWTIANYLDDTSFYHGKYGYYNLEIGSADSDYMSIPAAMDFWLANPYGIPPEYFPWRINTYPHEGMGSDILFHRGLPYTGSYFEFYDTPYYFEVNFDGEDEAGSIMQAYSGNYQWHSWWDSYSWYRMGQTFTNLPADATLKFWSNYDIEENWDYGYVEVHNLNTGEWTTLPGLMTTDYLPVAQDNPNCPNDMEPGAYDAAGKWNAFTGDSGGWYQEEMDLSMFAGMDIELYFTYWTDANTEGLGWFIDDIEISGTGFYFFDDVEAGEDGWIAPAGWYRTDGIIYNDFTVNFIQTTSLLKRDGTACASWNFINNMRVDDDTETGSKLLIMPNNKWFQTTAVMIVANQPGFEHTLGSDYSFTADSYHPHFWWWHW